MDQQGAEAFEQGDEAFAEATRLDPGFLEAVELDPSIDPELEVDDKELEEAGARLDDPEAIATLSIGIDDPDGVGGPTDRKTERLEDEEGWALDTPLTKDGDADE
jgi:hypothetical protein